MRPGADRREVAIRASLFTCLFTLALGPACQREKAIEPDPLLTDTTRDCKGDDCACRYDEDCRTSVLDRLVQTPADCYCPSANPSRDGVVVPKNVLIERVKSSTKIGCDSVLRNKGVTCEDPFKSNNPWRAECRAHRCSAVRMDSTWGTPASCSAISRDHTRGISLRTDDDWWLRTADCGLLRSTDAGRTWSEDRSLEEALEGHPLDQRRPTITTYGIALFWVSDKEGLAVDFGNTDPSTKKGVVRTTDAGVTWHPVDTVKKPGPLAFENTSIAHVGTHFWGCGRDRDLFVSTNGGESFRAQTVPKWTQPCELIDFIDPLSGWAIVPVSEPRSLPGQPGVARHLWRTSDGGVTWSDAGAILDAAAWAVEPYKARRRLFRLTGEIAYLANGKVLGRTLDGGKTWTTLDVGDAAAGCGDHDLHSITFAGKRFVARVASFDPTHDLPILNLAPSPTKDEAPPCLFLPRSQIQAPRP